MPSNEPRKSVSLSISAILHLPDGSIIEVANGNQQPHQQPASETEPIEQAAAVPLPVVPFRITDHAPDWSQVRWFGTPYYFTRTQRPIIAMLWAAWKRGTPFVSQDSLLREADSNCSELRSVMRTNPAWGTMIQRGSANDGPPATYCLVVPSDTTNSPQ